MKTPTQSGIISAVLRPAVGLWLRSQVEHLEDLQIQIEGGDRQILSGFLPKIGLASHHAVYQGLHLSAIELTGENIRINLGEMIKGKPFRLLEPILITGQVMLTEDDIQASLSSSLLISGLKDLLIKLVEITGNSEDHNVLEQAQIIWESVKLHSEKIILQGIINDSQGNNTTVRLCSGLALANDHTLQFHPIQVETPSHILDFNLTDFQIDLGSDVSLKSLDLTAEKLSSEITLTVRP